MTSRDFLTFAKTLYNSKEEAARRTSVSRAYYALYHHVRNCFLSSGIRITTRPEEHQRMIRYLSNSGIQGAKYIGSKMSDMREERNKADYNLSANDFNVTTCALHCTMTESLIDQLDKIDKTQLSNGLRKYAENINEL